MKYEEKFNKYLQGTLDKEASEEIETDIEKMQVLLEHMDIEPEEALSEEEIPGKKESGFSKRVSGAVRRKFRTYVVMAVALATIIVLLIIYGLSPLLNSIYYSPVKRYKEDGAKITAIKEEFIMGMDSYSELFCGDKGFADVSVQEEGYGKYSIELMMQIAGKTTNYPLQLTRNHLYAPDSSWKFSSLPINGFTRNSETGLDYCGLAKEEAIEKLAQLPDHLSIQAAISFDDTKNAQEIIDFMEKYEGNYMYVPIVIESIPQEYWGFAPDPVGYDRSDLYDHEKYPYLELNQKENGEYPESITADMMEQHMKSLIRYVGDHEEFGEIFIDTQRGIPFDKSRYEAVLMEIEAKGIQGYGAVVFATKESLLKMLEDPSVEGAYMMDIRWSL